MTTVWGGWRGQHQIVRYDIWVLMRLKEVGHLPAKGG